MYLKILDISLLTFRIDSRCFDWGGREDLDQETKVQLHRRERERERERESERDDPGEVAQSCPTLCDPIDCSPPGSSVHGIFQARVLEWVAISFSRGSSQPRD